MYRPTTPVAILAQAHIVQVCCLLLFFLHTQPYRYCNMMSKMKGCGGKVHNARVRREQKAASSCDTTPPWEHRKAERAARVRPTSDPRCIEVGDTAWTQVDGHWWYAGPRDQKWSLFTEDANVAVEVKNEQLTSADLHWTKVDDHWWYAAPTDQTWTMYKGDDSACPSSAPWDDALDQPQPSTYTADNAVTHGAEHTSYVRQKWVQQPNATRTVGGQSDMLLDVLRDMRDADILEGCEGVVAGDLDEPHQKRQRGTKSRAGRIVQAGRVKAMLEEMAKNPMASP
jgi:hypothetical protein